MPKSQFPFWGLAAAIGIATISYWAFIGVSLDKSIREHTAECERRLPDPARQQCVVAFIPIPK